MALRWLTDTGRGATAADSGISSGTAHLWWQIRVRGSFFMDRTPANPQFIRWAMCNTDSPSAPTSTTIRNAVSFRKMENGNYEIVANAIRADDDVFLNAGSPFAIATLDALLEGDQYYTIYARVFSGGTSPQSEIQIWDDEGDMLVGAGIGGGSIPHPLGDHTRLVIGWNFAALQHLDCVAIGTMADNLTTSERHLSPETHGKAIRYWLFEDGEGGEFEETGGNGQTLVMLTGAEGTDWEYIEGDWGAGAPPEATLTAPRHRWRNDDGDEETATYRAAENAATTAQVGETVRLRTQIQAEGDPGEVEAELRYRVQGSEDPWKPVR